MSSITDFLNILGKSQKILLAMQETPSDDVLASLSGLYLLLKKQQKEVSIIWTGSFPERLSFLGKPDQILKNLDGSRDFVLIFKTSYNKILAVGTEEKTDEYLIRVTPEKGSFDPRDFSFMPADFKYDLVIILGSPSLDSLGATYQENTDLFFEVPKVNIDNKSSNESYGQVNIVDMTASSVAEILAEITFQHFESAIDKEIAQSFLTGLVSATESFQKPNTTPNAMILAAKLMKEKADQQMIIRHLYKTKSFSFLKLWGRVMARLNWNENKKLAWSLVSIEDFVQSRASEKDIPYVLEQIQENFSHGQIFAVFFNETPSKVLAKLRFSNEKIAQETAALFECPTNSLSFDIVFENKNLLEAEKEFLEKLEEK